MTKKTNEKNYVYREVIKTLKQQINEKDYSTAESFTNGGLSCLKLYNKFTIYFKGCNITIANDKSIHSAKFTIIEMRAMRNIIKDYIYAEKGKEAKYEQELKLEMRLMAEERLFKKEINKKLK